MTIERSECIRALAEVIQGLEVPASIQGGRILGTANEPWRKLYSGLNCVGWASADEIEEALRKVL